MTTPELWRRARALFASALEQPPESRETWVREAAGGDGALASEVLSLLAHHREDDGFLDSIPPWMPADLGVGPYRLVREIGVGGMGVVWEAERSDDLYTRRVAIKFIKRGMDSEEVLRRFRREREILARLEHPNIARLLDAGITDDGRPWFAMEFVEGAPITAYCHRTGLSLRDRLVLFRSVCRAVHFAHRNLVVHRDLKPSNILVATDGTAKLLDFGVARLLDPEAGGVGELTRVGVRPMTPAYASPELRQGRAVTTASDVYALGLVLNEILTGSRRGPAEDEGQASGRKGAGVEGGNRTAPGRELRAIVRKAVEHDPEDRYSSTAELDDDVGRFLAGFPVRARPDSALYRIRSFIRRNHAGVAAAVLVGLLLVAAGSFATWQARIAVQERSRAEAHAAELRQISTTLLFEVHDAIAPLPGATQARELIVGQAFDHLERLAALDAGDPALAMDVARGYLRLASVLANPTGAGLSDREGARTALMRAVELAEMMWQETTTSRAGAVGGEAGFVEALALRAEALRRWGEFLAWEGEVEAGLTALARSLDAFERLAELRPPSDETAHLEIVIAHIKIGDHTGHPVFRNLGEPQGALDRYAMARAVLSRSPLDRSQAWAVRRFRGLLDERVGAIHRSLGDPEAALEPFRASLAQRVQLASEDPNHLDALRDVAIGHQLLCQVEAELGRPDRGIPDCEAALERFRELRELDLDNRAAAVDLAIMQGAAAQVQAQAGDRAAARSLVGEAIRTREAILAGDPGNTVNPRVLAELRTWLAALAAEG